MKRYLTLYLHFVRYSLMQAVTYRENFAVWSLVTIGWTAISLVFYRFLFASVTVINGWTQGDVLVVLGFYFMFDFVLWGFLGHNMNEINRKVNQGTLDLDLAKPVNLQFLLSFRTLGFDDVHSVILGIITIGYGLWMNHQTPAFFDVLWALGSFAVAVVFVYAAWFMTMCTSFWFSRADNLYLFFPAFRHFWKIPQPLYRGLMRGVLTYVLPVTLVTTVPAQMLLGKPNWGFLAILTVFAGGFLFLSRIVLRVALKRYSSASS